MGVGGVLTTEGLIFGRRQWEVVVREREKKMGKRKRGEERGRIYNRKQREREKENGKGRYFGSCEINK